MKAGASAAKGVLKIWTHLHLPGLLLQGLICTKHEGIAWHFPGQRGHKPLVDAPQTTLCRPHPGCHIQRSLVVHLGRLCRPFWLTLKVTPCSADEADQAALYYQDAINSATHRPPPMILSEHSFVVISLCVQTMTNALKTATC